MTPEPAQIAAVVGGVEMTIVSTRAVRLAQTRRTLARSTTACFLALERWPGRSTWTADGEQPTTVSLTFPLITVARKIGVIASPVRRARRGARSSLMLADAKRRIYTGRTRTGADRGPRSRRMRTRWHRSSGAHMTLVLHPRAAEGAGPRSPLVVGGTIPNDDVIELTRREWRPSSPGADGEIVDF
jgi:hypothetical protein